MRHFAFLIVLSLVASLWAAHQPFERYQSIVDRQMFGPLPPDFDPEKMPSEVKGGGGSAERQMTQEQAKLQESVRFSGIRVSPDDEVFVSFSDMADPKNPRSYYMKVGETSGGWTVLEADPVKATMTVEKDGVEVSLTIGGTSGKDGAGAVKAAGGAAPGIRAPMNSGLLGGSLSNRRLRRQQRAAEAQREADAKRQAEESRREQERQAEAEQRAQEREEQRRQLLAIQEELRKARESRSQGEGEAKESDGQDES